MKSKRSAWELWTKNNIGRFSDPFEVKKTNRAARERRALGSEIVYPCSLKTEKLETDSVHHGSIKEVYETSPKMTWQQLVDFVAEELGCEIPSASVVRRKALAEKWKKRTKSLVKKSARELNNEIKKMTSQKTGRKNSQADDSKDKKGLKMTSKIRHFYLLLLVKVMRNHIVMTAFIKTNFQQPQLSGKTAID